MALPEGLNELTGLQVLHLGGCFNMTVLPEKLGSLTDLQDLNLHRLRVLRADSFADEPQGSDGPAGAESAPHWVDDAAMLG